MLVIGLLAAAMSASTPAPAQDRYPLRPVRLVIPSVPAGVHDVIGRVWAERVKPQFGALVIDNRGGGAGSIGANDVAHAAPDGYSILLGSTTTHVLVTPVMANPPYDPVKDFSAVTVFAYSSTSIVVNASVPVRTLSELIAYAKANPGKLSYGSAGVGSITHLAGEYFKQLAGGLDIVAVPALAPSSQRATTRVNVMNVIRPPQPVLDKRGEPHVRRFEAQRWLLDNIIRANGIDWDQPRSLYLSGPCGNEANADFAGIRERVKKMADIGPAFEAVARRREAKAKAAEEADRRVTARDNYFMAAVHWGAAQWPYDQNDETNIAYNNKKRECYAKYAALAEHHVEAVWVPFRDKAIPAWLHLPPGYKGGRIPAVIAIPGMDSFKEIQVALYGDRFLNRGMAVLAIDGPGQYEAPMIGVYFSVENWMAAGKPLVDWLSSRSEIDGERIGCSGTSFGTFFGTILTAHEPRIRAFAAMSVCHEPGCHTIFQEASPTFKKRFMYMSGITDEDEFDKFRKTITWEGHADKIRAPYLVVAGECEELSPIEHSERLIKTVKGPKQMVVYQESRHSVGNVPAANLGPFPPILVADWMAERLAGKPLASEHWFVRSNGQIDKTPY